MCIIWISSDKPITGVIQKYIITHWNLGHNNINNKNMYVVVYYI